MLAAELWIMSAEREHSVAVAGAVGRWLQRRQSVGEALALSAQAELGLGRELVDGRWARPGFVGGGNGVGQRVAWRCAVRFCWAARCGATTALWMRSE